MAIKFLNIRHLLVIAILALTGVLAVQAVRNYTGAAPEEILESLPDNVDLSLKEIRYTETQDGIPRWTLVADSAAHSVGESATRIENVRMTFFGIKDHGDMTLTARHGELKTADREVQVEGDVVITSPKGYSFYTDTLRYRDEDRMFFTDDPVRIVSRTLVLTGTGMRLDVQGRTLRLLSQVRARVTPEEPNGDEA